MRINPDLRGFSTSTNLPRSSHSHRATMVRPQPVLRQCLSLQKSLTNTSATRKAALTNRLPAPTLLKANDAVRAARPFHSTSSRQRTRAPAPAARMSRKEKTDPKNKFRSLNPDFGVYFGCLSDIRPDLMAPVDSLMAEHMRESKYAYEAGIRDGLIPTGISEATYRNVGAQLVTAAFAGEPSSQAIRAISTDADAVFRIGWMVTASNRYFRGWLIAACANAGALLPYVIYAKNSFLYFDEPPMHTPTMARLFEIADKGYPPALLLQAQVLHQHGDYKRAAEILETKVLPYLSPSGRKPIPFEDVLLGELLPSPLRLYALTQATLGDQLNSQAHRDKSDEAIRRAALEFNDPGALLDYASLMMNQHNLEMYEECMGKAAAAGSHHACLYLANFYYLTYQGLYPTRGEQKPTKANPNPAANWKPVSIESRDKIENLSLWQFVVDKFQSSFNRAMPRHDYHLLAHMWYDVASGYGEPRAYFMHALLSRDLNLMFNGRMQLESAMMDKDPLYAKKIKELKLNWYNKDYEPSVPRKMLPVR
ncbi:hypothetical protein N7466_007056 [Penicillium verhagenii]|uniref:uncharacterized protein n=1 Tax=Penicillium verhagenii TaxID=1562060 RepID=UPI002545308B|nr:uncharacterized protein N7466_007056 [Penicillium verhagenii]KAJ5928100.1 hypothetical protein N7466_007056 [Penicillium verhagenii]